MLPITVHSILVRGIIYIVLSENLPMDTYNTLLATLSFLFAVFSFYITKPKKRLTWAFYILNDGYETIRSSAPFYDRSFCLIQIWNNGRCPITRSDFETPIKIRSPHKITETHFSESGNYFVMPGSENLVNNVTLSDSCILEISPNTLNPGNTLTIGLVGLGISGRWTAFVDAHVNGLNELTEHEDVYRNEARTKSLIICGLSSLILMPFGFGIWSIIVSVSLAGLFYILNKDAFFERREAPMKRAWYSDDRLTEINFIDSLEMTNLYNSKKQKEQGTDTVRTYAP